MTEYWRDVLSGALKKTYKPLGWSKEKAVSLSVLVIGTLAIGGVAAFASLLDGWLTAAVGISIVAVVQFLWGIIETQREMYVTLMEVADETNDKLQQEKAKVKEPQARPAKPEPRPDYEKWRHRKQLSLKTAAQLWSGVMPQAGLFGPARETYEMLQGAIQNRELAFVPKGVFAPNMQDTSIEMQRKNPNQDTEVTRDSLKTFATRYGYDPEFLRDK